MPKTLVTGANGYVGATVLQHLIDKKHNIVAAVRSLSSAKPLLATHPDWPTNSKLEWVAVPDFTASGAFDKIFQSHPDIEYIIHVAAPVLDNPANTDFVEHFEKPSIQGNTELLTSALNNGKNIKAISVVSSINAISTGDPADLKSRVLDSSQWLPLGRDDAIQAQNPYVSYCVAKSLAEKAIWSFVEKHHPPFSITVFNPPIILGPPLQAVSSMSKINWSSTQFYSFLRSPNDKTSDEVVPPTTFPGYVDVRDLAELLTLALDKPAGSENKRFVVGQAMSYRELSKILRESGVKGLAGRVKKENSEDDPVKPRLDTKYLVEVFGKVGWKYTDIEKTVRDTAERMVEIEGKVGA